jgi:DHA1 family tetracycline resistance protein-like MFS transporter
MQAPKRSALLVVFLAVFIDLLGFAIVVPLLPLYARDLNAGGLTLGLLLSSFSAMQFLFSPVWGRVSDRVGRRPVLVLGLASSAIFYALFGYATLERSLLLIFVARMGAGMAGATISTAQAYIADVTTPENRARGMALIGAAFGLGFVLGPLLGSIWVSGDETAAASAAPGFVAAALSSAAFVFAVFVLPESRRPGAALAERHWLDVGAFRAALQVPTMGRLFLTFFTATLAFGSFESTISLLSREVFHFTMRDTFFLFSYLGVLLTLAQGVVVRHTVSRVGEVPMTIAGAALMAVALVGVGLAAAQESLALILSILPVIVLGFAALQPSVQSLISRRSDPSIQGSILGVAQSVSALARIAGPLFGNILYARSPSHTLAYYAGAGVMVLALLLSLGLTRDPSRVPDDRTQLNADSASAQ